MRDTIPNHNNSFQQQCNVGGFHGGRVSQNIGSSVVSHKKKKSDYCWNFNKGINCKYGKKCRFIERCSYCDSDSHGVVKCPKVEKRLQVWEMRKLVRDI